MKRMVSILERRGLMCRRYLVVLTIRRHLVSAAQRCQKTSPPWSHFCWSDPNPTPPLTNACLYLYLWGYYSNTDTAHVIQTSTQLNALDLFATHKLKYSSQVGLREHLMVLVFCLLSLFGSGINLSLTYGSDRPFGSIGTKLRASLTIISNTEKHHLKTKRWGKYFNCSIFMYFKVVTSVFFYLLFKYVLIYWILLVYFQCYSFCCVCSSF